MAAKETPRNALGQDQTNPRRSGSRRHQAPGDDPQAHLQGLAAQKGRSPHDAVGRPPGGDDPCKPHSQRSALVLDARVAGKGKRSRRGAGSRRIQRSKYRGRIAEGTEGLKSPSAITANDGTAETEHRLKIIWTPPFERAFQNLPQEIQAQAEKALALLFENPRHPSLRVKKMHGVKDLWEARVSRSYRITYRIEGDRLILRQIGTHDILKKETR